MSAASFSVFWLNKLHIINYFAFLFLTRYYTIKQKIFGQLLFICYPHIIHSFLFILPFRALVLSFDRGILHNEFDFINLVKFFELMNPEQMWQIVLNELELVVSKPNFLTWFQNTSIKSFSGSTVIIGVPNGFTKEWLEKKYNKTILEILKNIDNDISEIKYEITPVASPAAQKQRPSQKQPHHKNGPHLLDEGQLAFQELNIDKETNLNPRYSFDSFTVGPFNELAHAAVSVAIKNLGVSYNPLFIYGDVGLGKTHLLQAAGNEIKNLYPNLTIRYVQAEKFITDLINALLGHKMDDFKNTYRNIDVFIIDDVQFITGKEKTQEELFHTFNTLYEKNKQIILSSDRPPKAIPMIEDRLRSRFEGGMIADIGAPDLETRIAILKEKLIRKNTSLDDDIIQYIAKHFDRNIRELEGALTRVLGFSQITKTVPSLSSVVKLLNATSNEANKNISFKDILQIVAKFYDIDEKFILSKNRRQEIVKARQIVMYLMRDVLHHSFPHIGQKLGSRDHSTVIHAYNKIESELKESQNLSEELKKIKQQLYR